MIYILIARFDLPLSRQLADPTQLNRVQESSSQRHLALETLIATTLHCKPRCFSTSLTIDPALESRHSPSNLLCHLALALTRQLQPARALVMLTYPGLSVRQ
jgi:hypothetical protein